MDHEAVIQSLRDERDRIRQQLRTAEGQLAEANRTVLRLTDENENLQKLAKNWEKDSDRARQDNDRLRDDMRLQREEILELREQLKEAKVELQRNGHTTPGLRPKSVPDRSPSLQLLDGPPAQVTPKVETLEPQACIQAAPAAQAGRALKRAPESEDPRPLSSSKRIKTEQPQPSLSLPPSPLTPLSSLSPIPESTLSTAPQGPTAQTATPPVTPKGEDDAGDTVDTSDATNGVQGQPDVKVKEEAIRLSSSAIQAYLAGGRRLEISPRPDKISVSRKFVRLAYGGSDQQFVQKIPAEKNPSAAKIRRLVWPKIEMNPSMPRQPGDLGLLFASRHDVLHDGPWTVFCRDTASKETLWCYLGEYESVLVGKMTAEQFREQKAPVKAQWGSLLLSQRQQEVYVAMRARIALRRAGLIPTDSKNEDKKLIATEIQNVRENRGHPVEAEDIIQAFERGDEGIDIIRMDCVAYDRVFANDLRTKFRNYPQMLATGAQKKGGSSKAIRGRGKPNRGRGSPIRQRPSPSNPSIVRGRSALPEMTAVQSAPETRSPRPPRVQSPGSTSSRRSNLPSAHSSSTSSRPRRNRSVWDHERGERVRVASAAPPDTRENEDLDPPSESESMASFYMDSDTG